MKFSGDNTHVLSTILKSAQPLTLTKPAEDYAALLEHIGDAKARINCTARTTFIESESTLGNC